MAGEGKKFVVTCEERCRDGKKARLYYPGDKELVDPLDPIAKYFGGWPPGTEVYTKSKGKAGTRIVPGVVEEAVSPAEGEEGKPGTSEGLGSPVPKPKKAKGKKAT